ncbi:MAG: type IIL restriction-modification enzyme MmeI [Caulobacteraceae bacterium]
MGRPNAQSLGGRALRAASQLERHPRQGLRKAHRALDLAVDRLYRKRPFESDRERVEHLFGLYEAMTAPMLPAPKGSGGRVHNARGPRSRPSSRRQPA